MKRLLPSGIRLHLQKDRPFRRYLLETSELLRDAQAGHGRGETVNRADGNSPFEMVPDEGGYPIGNRKQYLRGVLLIHGLTDSPYFMRYLSAFFRKNGFRVMAILLPGHGSCPGDLLDVRWQEWAETVAYGVDCLSAEADEVYLAGLSLGGALSISHSLQDERVRGLFLFAPALRISPWAAWANLHKLYSWLYPAAKWVDIMPDENLYKYESFPKNAAYQMYALTRHLRTKLKNQECRIPIFIAASADDKTADIAAILEFMGHSSNPYNRLVYYTRNPSETLRGLDMGKVEMVPSVVPELNIISFSHLSIVLPPEDAYYGACGMYANCLHYYPDDMEKYAACKRAGPEISQGEVLEENLRSGIMRRLMYNPHFEKLKISMRHFIDSLP